VLVNTFILIFGCNSFFIMMRKPKEWKAFSVQEKVDIPDQVYVNKQTRFALAARYRIAHWQ
jgi:hypothetical protein